MKVTYDWLKNYTDFDIQPEELVHTLTMLGLEVDSFTTGTAVSDGIVVGEVVAKSPHPQADRLSVCDVKTGSETLQIVCGAPNVAVGQKVPVAVAGSQLPSGARIEQVKIRGVESRGMICSEAELGLSNRSDGIMVLNGNANVGAALQDVLGEPEVTIDVDVTPNRPDCFGAIGIAREIATVTENELVKPTINIKEGKKEIDALFAVEILDTEKCPRFTARFIGNVAIKPSPWWLVKKLEAVGIRSINNVVDVTNYVMMETGHPLHAYDYDLLAGERIVVKCAKAGERFITLDGIEHVLNDECLMICDGEKAVGVAGIMGGQNTEVSQNTKNILLECAYFDPRNIRRTSKHLEKSTEASKRFERGVDPNGLLYALDRATQLIADLAMGEVAQGVIDVYPREIRPASITLQLSEVKRLLGITIPQKTVVDILRRLGFEVAEKQDLEVSVPTFRPDVTRPADLIEEIARIYGYDNIPADCTAFIDQLAPVNEDEGFQRKVAASLQGLGFSEVTTYNLVSRREAGLLAPDANLVELINPLSEELSVLRPCMLPGLLRSLRWNLNRKITDVKIFEIGTEFSKSGETVTERTRISAVLTGSLFRNNWKRRAEAVDFFDLKGYVEQLLARNYVPEFQFEPLDTDGVVNPKQALAVKVGDVTVGKLGQVQTAILKAFDIDQEVFMFDLDYRAVRESVRSHRTFEPIPKFPAVVRDLALLVDREVAVEALQREMMATGGEYLRDVEVFDVYLGEQVAREKKSVAFKLTFQSAERTLVEEEVDASLRAILSALSKGFACELRS